MKAVHFGAGNIGRGFIGNVLSESGYEICFVDINSKMINELNKNKFYLVQVLDEKKSMKKVSFVSGLNSTDQKDEIADKIVSADIITTSVGVNNLVHTAPIIAKGLLKRFGIKKESIDIIANENAINASSKLKDEVLKLLNTEEKELVNKYASFPNSAIDRQALSENMEGMEVAIVEPYYEWVINKSEIINEKTLSIKGVTYVENMDLYIERKLYCVNAGHATAAYIGSLFGKKTIQEALATDEIKNFVKNTMLETSQYLIKKYNMQPDDMKSYVKKTIQRHENPNIQDSVERVGASPKRKLGYDERLTAPARKLYEMNMPVTYICKVIAVAFHFYNPEDMESVEIQEYVKKYGIEKAVKYFTKVTNNEIIKFISDNYELIKLSKDKCLEN